MTILPLSMSDITKRYGAVQALRGVHLNIGVGECLAVVGENGAGKSTLMKILAGVERPDTGTIHLDGHPTVLASPRHAQDLGICLIHQELQLVPHLSVIDNMFLGREQTRMGFLRVGDEEAHAQDIVARLGLDVPLRTLVSSLSVAEQQLVEIAKGLTREAQLVIMDEPTAALAPREVERLMAVIRVLLEQRRAVIYISHRIDEVAEIAHRVLVLRDGQVVGELPAQTESREVVRLMIGHEITEFYPRTFGQTGEIALEVQGLSAPGIRDIDFELRHGEIIGIGGLVGAGQRELADALFGRTRITSGKIWIGGRSVSSLTPFRAIADGMSLVSENRRIEGLNMKASILDNVTLPVLHRLERWPFLDLRQMLSLTTDLVARLHVRATSPFQMVTELSGGNQQKVVLAKALISGPDILILVEPTRGVDVGAKVEIYELLDRLTSEGKAMLIISSDLDELRGMADRVLILYRGQVTGSLARSDATRERITMLATGQRVEV